jgi:hypothetical protein
MSYAKKSTTTKIPEKRRIDYTENNAYLKTKIINYFVV